MSAILGISAFYHDSAAALIVDGKLVGAAQEERFTRKKHDPGFPRHAVDWCLDEAGLKGRDLDWVVFYDKPLRKFERLIETHVAFAPAGLRAFSMAMSVWAREKLSTPRALRAGVPGYTRRFVFAEHHESHAASAFFPSPYEEAAILTMDGVGEWATASSGTGRGSRIALDRVMSFPHSLGLLYSAFTHHVGFKVNSGEYKLMGLAPYGKPRHAALIREHLIDIKEDGSFRLAMPFFRYCQGLTMTSPRFDEVFGPRRKPESPLTEAHADLAASIQEVTEDIVLRIGRDLRTRTGMTKLVMAGGVALNCVANGVLLREGPFDDVWVQPAAGDAGGALGAALFAHHQLLGAPREVGDGDSQQASLLGPAYSDDEAERALSSCGARLRMMESGTAAAEEGARLLAEGNVVGWFQGRMEFGPRALGSRSILGDPRDPNMQSVMNLKIKFRESFRPFAPSVLKERAADWFEVTPGLDSPYMMFVAPVAASRRIGADDAGADVAFGIERLMVQRSTIPAVTHVDGSARIQTVDERHGRYFELLRAFERRTGCPVVINTSFNVRGEPIVLSPEDAYRCFRATAMDALIVGRCVMLRDEQAPLDEATAEAYRQAFDLD